MIAMTMMVRDEADIVGAMVQHHLDQGVGLFLVTDNGSVDGTAEILAEFADAGRIELTHDPRHLKQQHEVVTRMSREAARRGATWVLNADADEFWISRTRGLTLRDELKLIDPAIGSFSVPVHDMTGDPALSGTGLQRLIYRDERPVEVMQALGINAHATPDVAFAASESVEVAQGNHSVNISPSGELAPGRGLEVYHFPWRSLDQFTRKVQNAGRSYEASPHLRPSANHHGMRDYRRLKDGVLEPAYIARHPTAEEITAGLEKGWFVTDRTIADAVQSPAPDVGIDPARALVQRDLAQRLQPLEERTQQLERARREAQDDLDFEKRHVAELDALVAQLSAEIGTRDQRLLTLGAERDSLRVELERLRSEMDQLRSRRLVRAATTLDAVRARLRPRS